MTNEFVDFYEILSLPLDADRSTVRKRINELYVEAQRNLDHRNFATRVKYQELFEVTLPQARYILLDEGRRSDYDRLVRDTRAPAGAGAPGVGVAAKTRDASSTELGQGGFKLSADAGASGAAPAINELPPPDPETIAREREEMWNKWKTGLQSAMEREAAREKAEKEAPKAASTSPAQAQAAPAPDATTPVAPVAAAPKPERPKVKFDFGGEADNTPRRGERAPVPGAEEIVNESTARLSPEEIERRRTEHRRELMKEELTDVGVKAMLIGASAVLVPGVIAMVMFMSRNYPHGETPKIAISSPLAWLLWMVFLGTAAFVASHFLSKSMRRKSAMNMSLMSYEDLLRFLRKDF